ncbi:SAM-dependent methyltransferase [Flavobacteriales bacterium 34_180_T64]|nr:SAM-dependent methyltransferase [Flavobacteriales bacterium 34_180_T64]
MNSHVLDTEVQEFINSHIDDDIAQLILKGSPFEYIHINDLIEQIEAKKKCKLKLPFWYNTNGIYFPNKLNIEQTSSEMAALFKSKLINGESIIDLTGGFGVDSFYFSNSFKSVTHCEIDLKLSNIVSHNLQKLPKKNITVLNVDGIKYLKEKPIKFDWIYVDPSRRHNTKGKVFLLKDCLPNIPKEIDTLWDNTDNIIIKTSPLLDISIGIDELDDVKTIHIVGINNEVKELLWILEKGYTDDIRIESVNLRADNLTKFSFNLKDESIGDIEYKLPQTYLYEPNAPTLKAGAFNSISHQLGIAKIHKHSHLYTNDDLIDFPGRRFIIDNMIPYHKKTFKKAGISKANITTRNFPETVQQIRNKFSIKDGGDIYLFFTTNYLNEKVVLVCSKVE